MAHIQSNGTGGGDFSAGGSWNGGVAPGDDDSWEVLSGDTISFDVDSSGYASGFRQIDVDGTLSQDMSGSYCLKMKAGYAIQGDGTWEIGSTGSPLADGDKLVVALADNALNRIQGNLTIDWHCEHPTDVYVRLSAQEANGQTVLSVDTDVTADAWHVGDPVAICNDNNDNDVEYTTIAAIGAGTITVNDALSATKEQGAFVVLLERPIEVRFNSASASRYGFYNKQNDGDHIECAMRNANAAQGVRGMMNAQNSYFRGVAGNMYYLVNTGTRLVIEDSAIAGSNYAINGLYDSTIRRNLITGSINGAILGAFASLIDTCVLRGNEVGIRRSNATYRNLDLANKRDFWESNGTGHGCELAGTTESYMHDASYNLNDRAALMLYDVRSGGTIQPGRCKGWNPLSELASEAAPANPPASLDYAHKITYDPGSDDRDDWDSFYDFPVYGFAGKALQIKCYVKANTAPSGFTTQPRLQIIDPNEEHGSAGSKLDDDEIADTTDWQTVTLSHTPDYDRPLVLRIIGAAAFAKYLHFAFEVQQPGVGGPFQVVQGCIRLIGPIAGLLYHPGLAAGAARLIGPIAGRAYHPGPCAGAAFPTGPERGATRHG